MGLATIVVDVAPIFEKPSTDSLRCDEALYGMSVQVIQESQSGWCYLRTDYGMEGYCPTSCLETDAETAAAWRKYRKMTVLAPYIDVQKQARKEAPRAVSLARGSILVPLGSAETEGYVKVGLPNGGVGYTRASYLGDVITDWSKMGEEDMRWNIVETALAYNGSAYRQGGRSPMGIDGVGLAAMSYYLNGVAIPRETFIKPGTALHAIKLDEADEGDLLYFSDGVGVYMGNGKFVHASSASGMEGVMVSSMREKDPEYVPELAQHIVSVGSIY